MATLPPPRAPRQSAMDFFDSFYEFDDQGQLVLQDLTEEQQTSLENFEITLEESKTFRPGAASTHNKFDRHLIEYRKACVNRLRSQHRIDNNVLQELVDTKFMSTQYDQELFFPSDRKELYSLFNYYLTVMAAVLKPRSNADDRPRLTTLTSRRWSLLHWAKVYLEDPPNSRVLQVRTNAALFYAVQRYGINTTRRNKAYFGRHEVRFLIDYDLAHTDSFDAAESHHLAWTIAMITGVRPGAIGRTQFRKDAYLRWTDIQITRNPAHVQRFNVTITFPYMKGFQDPSAVDTAWNDEGYLRLSIEPPESAENIPLSPAYRLLAIALKRGLLAGYKTYQDLLQGDELNILIKDDHLSDPIFPALGARGLSLDTTKAASSSSFTQYLNLRANAAGFQGITMYAFRRGAASAVDKAAGRSAVRMFMNHNPQSMTFEKSYENANFNLDVAAIAYDAIPQNTGATNVPVLYRAELVMTPEQLASQVEKYIGLHAQTDSPEYHLQRRRLKRQAMAALRQQAVEIHRKTFTLTELKHRVAELKSPSRFMEMITLRAQAMESTKKAALHRGMNDDDAAAEDDELDEEFEHDDDHVVDLEQNLELQEAEHNDGDEHDDSDESSSALVPSSTSKDVPYPRRPAPSPAKPDTLKVNYTANVKTAASFVRGNSQIFRTFTDESQQEWLQLLRGYQDRRFENTGEPYLRVEGVYEKLLRQSELGPPKMRGEIADIHLTLSTDVPSDLDQILTTPYESSLSAFFELMLEGQSLSSGAARQCAECLADDTLKHVERYKWWESLSKLTRHQETKIHAPHQKWIRKTKLSIEIHPEHKASCLDCQNEYARYEDLSNHLTTLVKNGVTETDPHYAQLVADGFFNPNFNYSRRAQSTHDRALRTRDDVVGGRKGKKDVPLSTTRPALLPSAPSEYPTSIVVGPQAYDPSLLAYPEAFRNMPRLTPQSFREDITARGLDGLFVTYVNPVDPANPAGREYKEHLESRSTDHLLDWGVPRQGDTKGKRKAPGAGEPTVHRL
ncbi:hypothetical protein E4T38_07921 [Aureobasidium subglaciale]|nr:hypothetical protein E4T38_07921 [Aureobasidium subglaciale]KAI5216420.1 hypothetical protein E4T40_07931 [Aureobasidium subglaciale]KAI5219646.1 hypothetical protein E4T41_07899 [Aureobasidium subglaciale]KAI5257628.1 hypothetical protein E4T46_07822 [Aureobasidium subglaciale]